MFRIDENFKQSNKSLFSITEVNYQVVTLNLLNLLTKRKRFRSQHTNLLNLRTQTN